MFVEGQKKIVETNWSNWELRSNQTDWGFMHNLFLHSTYLFIETKHFHIVRNCFENNNWMGYWGQTKLIGACGLPPAQHKHLKYQRAKHKHTFTNKSTRNQIYFAPKYTQLKLSIGCNNFYGHTLTFPSPSSSLTYICTSLPPISPPPPQPPQISNFPSLVFRGAHLPESWLPLLSQPNSTFISLHYTSMCQR